MLVYTRLGDEWSVIDDESLKAGKPAKVDKALYGLKTSGARFHAHLSDNLHSLGFKPTRFDPDVWIRPNGAQYYDYIGTHTDDLLCVSHRADEIMNDIRGIYEIKKVEEPSFHLGCDYRKNKDGTWSVGTETYVKEALKKVKEILGKETTEDGNDRLGRAGTAMQEKLEPELDETPFLDAEGHRKYQQLIGIAQWLVTCGRMDLTFALSSLSRFSSSPRQGHMKAAVHMFKYLNRYPSKWIDLDPSKHEPPGELESPVIQNGMREEDMDWSQIYPDAREEMDLKFPKPRGKELDTAVYFDANWAHDKVTRRSISGIMGFIGNTPVTCTSKRQGAIATSTYSSELCAAKVATEEAITLRYMLRSLGVPVNKPTLMIGDNLGSLISATQPGSPCKKKHSQIAYHYVRECVASRIISIRKIHTDHNYADANTKALGKNIYWRHYSKLYSRRH
jgi:hypothetical protein